MRFNYFFFGSVDQGRKSDESVSTRKRRKYYMRIIYFFHLTLNIVSPQFSHLNPTAKTNNKRQSKVKLC
jgi:hypothetical protein